jgi:3-hydroxyacyl-[acyl-carrier-protein] dehydratase
MLTNVEIQNIIPHRYPFLLVDKILEVEPGKKLWYKKLSANEPYFQGHFPGNPIMPECFSRSPCPVVCVAGLLMEENKGKLVCSQF